MQIIKLNATDSTNAHLKKMLVGQTLDDFTVVVASEQTNGRGQIGTNWTSEAGKNLTFSILKKMNGFAVDHQFLLNICVSLAVFNTLKAIHIPDLSIKWPNDILSGSSKVCGILIENTLAGNQIQASVIGIGLNVNQTNFTNLPNATSIKLLLGRSFDLDELLNMVLTNLEKIFISLEKGGNNTLWTAYENVLFRKNKPSTFQNGAGDYFMGFITGVSEMGKLLVTLEDDVLKEFNLKEVKLLY
ncbi:biotin--[acetyl-CoA-carboxylase] ligase [Kriegella aquimaris]|uniref:BirA family transcriptional regulator, biotin operon repressor / biotin-[acetyl-CoA-carboxylase] ligase n=1 Tax=Kriegella aquimaris TaxID=192904 RepID=A0A1G9X753_9FLAO|nr:biotin--[acetyl-CoA-carboxylase] ligase [Kriegella aquimaris]SDM92564.1 BirA family transcriptional regulator, biotin operon repressor / biotin-[acetyl-CoA-carboxylase] ligase [Kriegella aquimaris]